MCITVRPKGVGYDIMIIVFLTAKAVRKSVIGSMRHFLELSQHQNYTLQKRLISALSSVSHPQRNCQYYDNYQKQNRNSAVKNIVAASEISDNFRIDSSLFP